MRVSVRTRLINMPNRSENPLKRTDFTPMVTDTNGKAYSKKPLRKPLISVKFEKTPNISKIRFDCEAGGFFCYSRDLSVLEDLGNQFRKICLDKNGFAELVCTALEEAVIQDEEEKQCLTM